jgi:hypothetical protein
MSFTDRDSAAFQAGGEAHGLTKREYMAAQSRAIRALHRLSRTWPKTLTLFASGTLTVRKPNGGFPGRDTVVADIYGIPNEGGDGGDNEHD